jgi:hypothetical protein
MQACIAYALPTRLPPDCPHTAAACPSPAHPPACRPCPPLQAILWAWELSTKVYGLPAERVWVSVYEEDAEAEAIWRDVVGVPPERIKRMGAADNFWASGPTGELSPRLRPGWRHTCTGTGTCAGVILRGKVVRTS